MARYLLLNNQQRRRLNVPRVFRDRRNPFDFMHDDELVKMYRLNRNSIFDLCREIQHGLERPTRRSQALPVSLQLLIALHFYATGSFQSILAESHGVKLNSVSRSIHAVSRELCNIMHRYIQLPNRRDQLAAIKQGFYDIAEFPNVIGAVDGTFVPIIAPTEDEHLFVTRKGFHAINMQGICDSRYVFLNIVVRWPGSTHDAFIWNNCEVSRHLEEEDFGTSWFLGDSAYPLKRHLLTPVMNPRTQGEIRYNVAHRRTRSVIERAYGLWKMRFGCVHKSGGYLMYSPTKCVNIICSTVVLHNICINRRLPLPDNLEDNDVDDEDEDSDDDDDDERDREEDVFADGRQVRNELILNKFSVNEIEPCSCGLSRMFSFLNKHCFTMQAMILTLIGTDYKTLKILITFLLK